MSVSRAERRRQERAQRKAPPPPSDRDLVALLTEIAGRPVHDACTTLLEILPAHLARDLDECVDMLSMAELSYPKNPLVYRGWSLVHQASGNLHLSAWLAHLAGEPREFDLCLALREQVGFTQQRGDYGAMLEACSVWRKLAPDEVEPKRSTAVGSLYAGRRKAGASGQRAPLAKAARFFPGRFPLFPVSGPQRSDAPGTSFD